MKFSTLSQKYDAMREPGRTLTVGGQVLETGKDVRLRTVVCELTCRQESGSCFLEAELDPRGERGAAWLDSFQLGAVCSLSLGYGRQRVEVFRGLVYDLSWSDPLRQGATVLSALCLDARGQLMLSSRADAGGARTVSQLVKAVLDRPCCARLDPSLDIRAVPEELDLPARRLGSTDYDVVCALAELVCYEFYAFAGELYFGPARSERGVVVTFDGPNGLLELRRRRTLAGQCAAVAVSGTDDNGARVYARRERQRDVGFGAGTTGETLTGERHMPQPSLRTMAQARYLSQARMERLQRQMGGLSGRSVGLPELRPGRFIEVQGMSDPINGTYYVHTVRHTLDESGFETCFETEDREVEHGGA